MAKTTTVTASNAPNQQGETTIQVLGVQEVATRLGVPASSVYEMTRFRASNGQAHIPCRRIGRYLKFLSTDIDRWLLALPLSVNRTKRQYRRATKRKVSR